MDVQSNNKQVSRFYVGFACGGILALAYMLLQLIVHVNRKYDIESRSERVDVAARQSCQP